MIFTRQTIVRLYCSLLLGITAAPLPAIREVCAAPQSIEHLSPPLLPPDGAVPPSVAELPPVRVFSGELPSLFNCADCSTGRNRWFSDVNELRQTAYFCGFDYLQLRFTQHFSADSLAGQLTVYGHSQPGDAIQIDSAITAFRSPSGADQTVTVYRHHPERPFHLPLPSPNNLPHDPGQQIDAVVRNASTFSSRCRFRDNDLRDSWVFSVNGSTYLVEKGRLIIKDTPAPTNRSFFGTIEYRLATWGSTPRYQSAFAADHSVSPEIMALNINDSLSICRITFDCVSRYGLDYCIVSCGSQADTIRFSGEKQRRCDIILNADPRDSLLNFSLVDLYGNTAQRQSPLFASRRAYQKQWAEKRTLDLLTRERAAQNPLTYAAYLLTKFSDEPSIGLITQPDGSIRPEVKINPVTTLLKTIFRKKSENYLAAIKDFFPDDQTTPVTFPLRGTIQNNLFEKSTGAYSSGFYTDKCAFNGTQVALLVNPTLEKTGPLQQHCTFNIKAPLSEGRYPSSWAFDTSTGSTASSRTSTVLVCSDVNVSRGRISLRNLPCIFSRPSSSADFAVFHAARRHDGVDTLTVTYRICYTDRTSELAWQRFGLGSAGVSNAGLDGNRVVETSALLMTNFAGERCLLLDVHVNGSKKIFRVDTFVHSLRENQVVGWGVASLPG